MVGPRMRWSRRLRHGAALLTDSALSDADDHGRPLSALRDDAFGAFVHAARCAGRSPIPAVWCSGVCRRTDGPPFVGIAEDEDIECHSCTSSARCHSVCRFVDLEYRVQSHLHLISELVRKTTNAPENRGVCVTADDESGSDSAL